MESLVSTHNSNQVIGGGEDWVLEKMVGASHRCWERERSQLRKGQSEEFRPTVGQRASLKVVSRGQCSQIYILEGSPGSSTEDTMMVGGGQTERKGVR